MSITLTSNAAEQVQAIIRENDLKDHVVRVGVTVDPDAGSWNYALDIVDEVNDSDRRFPSSAVDVVCDPRSYLWVRGTEIDFSAADGGFQFRNPLEQ